VIPRWQRKPVILIAGIVAALFCSAGVATIMDWGVSPGKTPGERTGLIALLRGGDANQGVRWTGVTRNMQSPSRARRNDARVAA